MDTWGLLIMFVFGIAWLVTRKRNNRFSSFSTLMFGFGAGIIVAAVWALQIFNSIFP